MMRNRVVGVLLMSTIAFLSSASRAEKITLKNVEVAEVVNPAAAQEYRLMLKFDISAIPGGVHIDYAVLEFEAEVPAPQAKGLVLMVRRSRRAWTLGSPVWLKREEVDSLAAVNGVKAERAQSTARVRVYYTVLK